MQIATLSMFAPMPAILIGARMRALQIDPEKGSSQPWAQYCFYMCTYGVLFQTIAVLLTILPPVGAKVEDGVVKMSGALGIVMQVCQFVAMLCVYAGFTAVIVSIMMAAPAMP